jgi:hypothetical protein
MLKLKFLLTLLTIFFILFCSGIINIVSSIELQTSPQTPKIPTEQQAKSPLKTAEKTNQIHKITTNPPIITPANQSNELVKKSNNDGQKITNGGTEFCIFFGYKFRITDVALVAFTFLLFICTGILALIAYWQYTTMILSQRAFVFLKSIDVYPIRKPRIVEWRLMPRWENSGQTPTKYLSISVNCSGFDHELPEDFDFPYTVQKDMPMYIGPQSAITGKPFYIRVSDINNIRTGHTHFYIWGMAKYNDIFDKASHRCTKFCLEIHADIYPEESPPWFVYYKKHNCADEDCD